MKILKYLILMMIFSFLATPALALEAVLEAVAGAPTVAVKRGAQTLAMKKGDFLQAGDELKTDGQTAVDIRFGDKSIVRVGANSVYRLEQDSKLKSLLHRLLSGIVRVIVPPSSSSKDGPVRFRLDTPEGTIGVRGTEFVVIASGSETTLKGLEGEVLFGPLGADLLGGSDFVVVTEKMESSVRKGGKPSKPKEFDRAKYLREIDGKSGAFGKLAAARRADNYRPRSGVVAAAPAAVAAPAAPAAAPVKSMAKKIAPLKPARRDEPAHLKLFRAVGAANLPAAELALKAGADVNYRDEDGNTALHAACLLKNRDVLGFLVKKGADVNAKNKLGETPLMMVAAATGDAGMGLDLIDGGARAKEKNTGGLTALEIARIELAATKDPAVKEEYGKLISILEDEKN
jgi:hypothetical protein